jgi:hypothetical protein
VALRIREPPACSVVPPFGVNVHALRSDYTDQERTRMLDELQAAGVDWVRIDFNWNVLEPAPGVRDGAYVSLADRVVDAARARGMSVMFTLGSTPAWAGSRPTDPPADPTTYAAVARWAAAHFAGRVAAWGVYNSVNLHGWDPVTYANLLRAAYGAIKDADPTTLVVAGDLATNDAEWVAGLYAAGARGSFDVLATHPYQGPRDLPPDAPDIGVRWRLSHVTAVRGVMLESDDASTPIWFTEFGWSSHPNDPGEAPTERGVTLAQQAEYAVRAYRYVGARFPYVTNMFWYNERDKAVGDVQEDNYGLLNRDLSPKPVYDALKGMFASSSIDVATGVTEPREASAAPSC